MHKIRDWLYVSGYPAASSPQMLQRAGIESMLQLYRPFEIPGIESQYLVMEDGIPVSAETIAAGIAFVERQHAAGRTILVACGAGISRSVTMSVASLAKIEGLSLADAYRSVRRQHPHALPDHVHWQGIAAYFGDKTNFWDIWTAIMLED